MLRTPLWCLALSASKRSLNQVGSISALHGPNTQHFQPSFGAFFRLTRGRFCNASAVQKQAEVKTGRFEGFSFVRVVPRIVEIALAATGQSAA
jgi:hypothetical protein